MLRAFIISMLSLIINIKNWLKLFRREKNNSIFVDSIINFQHVMYIWFLFLL